MDGATPRWADIRAMAVEAEAIGFDAVWVSDHVGFGDPDTTAAGPAPGSRGRCSRRSPASRRACGWARTSAPRRTATRRCSRRWPRRSTRCPAAGSILGLGAGWNEPEFAAYGFPWERRFDRFEDGLRIVTSMLRTGRADHEGLETARGALVRPRGPRPEGLPVMVGASGPRMLRLAAELADEWNAGMRSPAELVPMLAKLDAALEAVGRDRASIRRSAEAMVRPGGGSSRGRRHREAPDALGNGDHPLTGTPEAVAAGLRRYFDLGCDHVQVQLRPNSLEGVRAFAPVHRGVARRRRRSPSRPRGPRRAPPAGRPGATPSAPRRVRRGG